MRTKTKAPFHSYKKAINILPNHKKVSKTSSLKHFSTTNRASYDDLDNILRSFFNNHFFSQINYILRTKIEKEREREREKEREREREEYYFYYGDYFFNNKLKLKSYYFYYFYNGNKMIPNQPPWGIAKVFPLPDFPLLLFSWCFKYFQMKRTFR